jgi:hypothetical protein
LGLAGPVLYFTFPEIIVRSSSGGYMAIENFLVLVIIYFYYFNDSIRIDGVYRNALFFTSGIIGGFASQKIAIVVIAMTISDIIRHDGGFWAKIRAPLNNRIIQGAILGTILFSVYGFLVDSTVFIDDFLKMHMIDRFRLNDVRFTYSDGIYYPSILDLWKEFSQHLGFPFLFVAVPLSVYTLFHIKNRESIFGLLFLVGAVAFSITDWRQTKHLMLIVIPMIISVVFFVCKSKPVVKYVFFTMLIFLFYNNVKVVISISRNFWAISPSPGW